jgi:hypothetical protein
MPPNAKKRKSLRVASYWLAIILAVVSKEKMCVNLPLRLKTTLGPCVQWSITKLDVHICFLYLVEQVCLPCLEEGCTAPNKAMHIDSSEFCGIWYVSMQQFCFCSLPVHQSNCHCFVIFS